MSVIRTSHLRPTIQQRLEVSIWIPVAALVAVGLLMVFSTSFGFGLSGQGLPALRLLGKHLAGMALGIVLLLLGMCTPLRTLRHLAPWLLTACIVLLSLVFVPGLSHRVGYHSRWISLRGWQFQPSEFAKVALVLFLATALSNRLTAHQRGRQTSLVGPLAFVGVTGLLVAAEPNFATAAVIGLAVLAMLYLAGEQGRLIAGLVLVAALLFVIGLQFDPGAKWERLLAFFSKGGLTAHARGIGYQTTQSVSALGAGGVLGWGLGASSAKFGALPFSNTDFVFAVLGQETGLVGCLLVLICYAALGLNGLTIGQRLATPFPSLLIAGLALTLTLQALVNIAVAVAWWVPMGVPLPFVSYGGSSLAASLAAVGLMINCARNGDALRREGHR